MIDESTNGTNKFSAIGVGFGAVVADGKAHFSLESIKGHFSDYAQTIDESEPNQSPFTTRRANAMYEFEKFVEWMIGDERGS